MDQERWQRLQELFHQAADLEGDELHEFLEKSCQGDDALRREVESLLGMSPGATGYLGRVASAPDGDESEDRAGERVGPYRLLRCLGEGGMGTVYLAERADGEFTQKVAIKLVRSPWISPQVIDRFRVEREILAQLEHPNIARLLDGGTTAQGQPYLAMEYVEGETIDTYCEKHELSTRARLELFQQVCAAVTYAHRRLIVHRDLKPANILVSDDGVPKLLDFGIARLLSPDVDTPALTQIQGPALTPEYASPEQVRGEPAGTASDIYSLGVLLYLLLAGAPPYRFETRTPQEIERVVCDQPPSRPSAVVPRDANIRAARLRRELSGDLDTIVMTALRKHTENRYPSVERMAEDVRHYLENRPISARPASRGYVARKFFRRHRAGVTTATLAVLALIGGAAMAAWGMFQAQSERDRAQIEAFRAEQSASFVMNMLSSIDPTYAAGADTELMRRVLEDAAQLAPTELEAYPDIHADIQQAIGRTYFAIGAHNEAREHLDLAAELSSEFPDRARHLGIQVSLAHLDNWSGDHTGAMERIETIFAHAQAHGSRDDPERMEAASLKVFLLLNANNFEEAEPIVRELIELTEGATDRVSMIARLESLGYLGRIQSNMDGLEESLRLFEQARAEAAAWEHPAARRYESQALHNQAVTLLYERQYAQAEPLLGEIVELMEPHYGSDHPMLYNTRLNLASAIKNQGRLDEAQQHFEELLEQVEESSGPDHPTTLNIKHNFGDLLFMQGDYAGAAALQRAAVAGAESAYPPGHPVHGIYRTGLAKSELAHGNAAAALELLEAGIPLLEQAFGADHFRTEEARQDYEEALEALARQDSN